MNPPGVVEVHIMLLPEAKLRHTFFSLCLGLENPGSSFHEFLFPMLNLIRMNQMFSRNLSHGQFPAQNFQCPRLLNGESYDFFHKNVLPFQVNLTGIFQQVKLSSFSSTTAFERSAFHCACNPISIHFRESFGCHRAPQIRHELSGKAHFHKILLLLSRPY